MPEMSLENVVFENARRFHENYLLKFQEHDLHEAIESYVEVLTLNPDKAECYYRLASLMYDSGQITLESTIEQCQKAINMNPDNINAYIYAGYYLEQAEKFSEAEKMFKKAINLSELKSARARLILASTIKKRIENQGYNFFGTVQYCYYLMTGFATLFADFTADKMIIKNLVDMSVFNGFRFIGKCIEKFSLEKALSFYKFGMKKTQRREYFYNKMASMHLLMGNIPQSLECYKELFKANPNDKSTLVKLATLTQSYSPEKIDLLIDYYTMLLDLEEDDLSPIYYELGHLYLQKNDKINSVSAFKLALEGNEDNAYYNDALAYAFVQAELYDDAIEYYQKAIKLNPERCWTVKVCHTLGLIYQKCKNNYEAAIASFQAGAILDSQNEEILLALGDVYALQKELDLAMRTYQEVISRNPDNYEAYSKLGIILWDKKNINKAIEAYKSALELNPEHDVTYNNLGIVYLEDSKDYNLALDYFNKAIEINPNYTLAYFNRGRALQNMGDFREAAKNYQMAIDLNRVTNSLDEKELQNKLQELFNV